MTQAPPPPQATPSQGVPRLAARQLIGSTFSFQLRPFADVATFLRSMGTTEVELWGVAPHLDLFTADDARVAEVGRILADNGLRLRCYTPEQVLYPVDIASGDACYRSVSIDRFLRAADIAAELGATYLFLTGGRGFATDAPEATWARSAEALVRIVTHAADRGLRCLLEPLQPTESTILHNAADLRRMYDQIAQPTVDVVLDLVAMAGAGDSVADYLRLFGDRIAHVHVVDGRPAGHLVWGDGTLPLGAYLTELAVAGYRGTLAFEPFGDGSYARDPETAWARNHAAIAPYLQEA
ncbi:MAG TPA: sugar phosphate isomerase/epimerase family protein [Paenirhodobacter sp.]